VVSAKPPAITLRETLITHRRYAAFGAVAAGIVSKAAAEDQVEARAIRIAANLASKTAVC